MAFTTTPELEPKNQETKDKQPPQSPQSKSSTLPTGTRMVTSTNVPPETMRQITQLMGKTLATTDTAQRAKTHQQLHDILFLTPGFISIYDVTREDTFQTDEFRKIFESANKFKGHPTSKTTPRTTSMEPEERAPGETGTPKPTSHQPIPGKDAGPATRKPAGPTPAQPRHAIPTPAQRTSRSNTKAPDIPPTPSVPIEHQSRKQPPK